MARIKHIALTTKEPAKVAEFYKAAFGLKELRRSPNGAVFLTDGKNDVMVEVTEQAPTSLKFKIPTKATAGRFALMLLTAGKDPKLIEQPVKLTVEE